MPVPEKKMLKPLPIRTYGFIFIIITLIAFTSLSYYAYREINKIDKTTIQTNQALAVNELTNAIDKISERINEISIEFVQWDELKQQLVDPTYYSYWHKARMPAAGFIPSYFITIELFDKNGYALNKNITDSPLYNSDGLTGIYIESNNGNPIIKHILQLRNSDNKLKGYALIYYDLFKIINNEITFRYIDRNSIHISNLIASFPLAELINNVEYSSIQNSAFHEIKEITTTTLIRLGVLGAILAFLLWYLLIVYASEPLRKLARLIDSMRVGEYKLIDPDQNLLTTTKEVESVKESINNFQSELNQINSALQLSEARLQTVIDNIPDCIITFDEYLLIDSINTAGEKTFGYKLEEIIGESISTLLDEHSMQTYSSLLEKLNRDEYVAPLDLSLIELHGIKKDKTIFDLNINIGVNEFKGRKLFITVMRDVSEFKKYQKKLQHLANYDSLTDLPNRILFQDRLGHAIDQAHRNAARIGLLFIDLDRFKLINDTMGHHIGDQLLKQAALRIRKCTREGDTVARLGGDEFTIINERIAGIDESIRVAKRVIQEMRSPFMLDGQEVFIAASIGITIYPEDAENQDDLIICADSAMYSAKDSGGDTYQLFTTQLSYIANLRMETENKLRQALDNREFEIYYQPRINIKTGKIAGMEALLRWNRMDITTNSPADFIPILEDTGMIVNIGYWIIHEATMQYMKWQADGLPEFRIAINLSARQFKQENLLEHVRYLIKDSKIKPENLEFEITESLLIEDIETTRNILKDFHDMGIHISIDDFGTGYSSLSYLKEFPIDTLKIDKSFLNNVIDNSSDSAITDTIIAIAKSLNMTITAEGIETPEQLEFLAMRDCDEAQGYLISKPLPAESIYDWFDLHPENKIHILFPQ